MKLYSNSKQYEVASIIKFVCTLNIDAVCSIAHNITEHYSYTTLDELDNIPDDVIYESYCNKVGDH